MRQRCKEVLRKESSLAEIADIIGIEGLQDNDRLLMRAAERIRLEFLCQNAYTEDAFSSPDKTVSLLAKIMEFYDSAAARLREGVPLDEILKGMRL